MEPICSKVSLTVPETSVVRGHSSRVTGRKLQPWSGLDGWLASQLDGCLASQAVILSGDALWKLLIKQTNKHRFCLRGRTKPPHSRDVLILTMWDISHVTLYATWSSMTYMSHWVRRQFQNQEVTDWASWPTLITGECPGSWLRGGGTWLYLPIGPVREPDAVSMTRSSTQHCQVSCSFRTARGQHYAGVFTAEQLLDVVLYTRWQAINSRLC